MGMIIIIVKIKVITITIIATHSHVLQPHLFSKTKMIFLNKQKVLENVEIFSEETQGINFSELQSLMTPLCLVSPR